MVDFFGMEMRGGKVRVVFNAGSTNIEAITNSSYNDGQFHKVSRSGLSVRCSRVVGCFLFARSS